MSVTFMVAQDPSHYTVECTCGANVYPHEFQDYLEASLVQNTIGSECSDDYCQVYPMTVCAVFAYGETVNVSNVNASHILSILGYEVEDLCGHTTGEDFLSRVLTAQALNPVDAGVPATSTGNFVDCGRREGYTDDVLANLYPIAQYAYDNNLDLIWS